jgi:hypothetical protein
MIIKKQSYQAVNVTLYQEQIKAKAITSIKKRMSKLGVSISDIGTIEASS